ncbi:MAG: hypothetical protein ABIT96_01115 [Ferruginibacter sp.]
MRYLFILITYLLFTADSCKKTSGDCPANQICTADFRTVTVTITQAGNPYRLDSFFTKKNTTGEILVPQASIPRYEDSAYKANGVYPIISDGQMNKTSKNGEAFTFYGYKNGVETIHEPYVLGHDCCHVTLISGNAFLTR